MRTNNESPAIDIPPVKVELLEIMWPQFTKEQLEKAYPYMHFFIEHCDGAVQFIRNSKPDIQINPEEFKADELEYQIKQLTDLVSNRVKSQRIHRHLDEDCSDPNYDLLQQMVDTQNPNLEEVKQSDKSTTQIDPI